jgi:putative ABC transport system ATP-binding protein
VILRLEDVSKRYLRSQGDRVALDQVSLELERGQIAGIFGPSGAGKTTLLRIAAGLLPPDSGSVYYDGERIDEMSRSELIRFRRREVACVWADSELRDGFGVLENVALPLLVDRRDGRAAERRAREALVVCDAEHCVGMELDELSDGERQRVAVARALVNEPRLLLADGPVSRLSSAEQAQIMGLLASLARDAKVAVLVADSDAETLLRADPILYLRDGRLIAPASRGEQGKVYPFPHASPRAAADA